MKLAKVFGPLHSISASGTVGHAVSFRATTAGAVVTSKARSYQQNSSAQLANQQRMLDARDAFRTLDSTDLTDWRAVGLARRCSAWAAFFAEYQYQYVQAPGLPLIPEPTL